MSDVIIGLGVNAVHSVTANLQNATREAYDKSIDNLFATAHNTADGDASKAEKYNAQDWERIGVKSRNDALYMVEQAQEQGLKAAVIESKINGQYMVEIQNRTYEVSTDDNGVLDRRIASQGQGQAFINKFCSENDVKTTDDTSYAYVNDNDRFQSSLTERADNFLAQNFDYLGRAISAFNNATDVVSRFQVDTNQSHYLDKTNPQGALEAKANQHSHQTAILLNNDTVMLDGKVCTDKAIIKSVMKQNEERIEKAAEVITKYEKKLEVFNQREGFDTVDVSKLSAKEQEAFFDYKEKRMKEAFSEKETNIYANACAVRDNLYAQEFEVVAPTSHNKYEGGSLDNEIKALNQAAYVAGMRNDFTLSTNDLNAISSLGKMDGLSISDRVLINEASSSNVASLSFNDRERLNYLLTQNVAVEKQTFERERASLRQQKGELLDKLKKPAFGKDNPLYKNLEQQLKQGKITQKDFDARVKKLEEKYKPSQADIAAIQKQLAEIDDKLNKLNENHAQTLRNQRALQDKLLISKNERAMMGRENSDTVKALKEDFKELGIGKLNAKGVTEFTRSDLIRATNRLVERSTELNKLGGEQIQLVKRGGVKKGFGVELDLDVLKGLTAEQLKKLGITAATRDALVKANRNPFARNRNRNHQTLGLKQKLVNKVISTDEDLAKMFNAGSKTITYSRSVGTSIHQFRTATTARIETLKAKILEKRKQNPNYKAKRPKKQPKSKKQVDPKVSAKRDARFQKKMERLDKKLKRQERSLFGKARKKIDTVVNKFMNTKVMKVFTGIKKALSKALFAVLKYVGIALLVIIGIIVIVAAVFAVIEAIANFVKGLLAKITPAYYKESIAVNLGNELLKKEEDWLKKTNDVDDIYKNKDKKLYGANGLTYDEYVQRIKELAIKVKSDGSTEGDLYINPFNAIEDLVTTDFNSAVLTNSKTDTNGFDGAFAIDIGANINATQQKNDGEEAELGKAISVESGHTSNIKDILAMIDVMYDSEMSNGNEDKMADIFGTTPAEFGGGYWENFWSNLGHNILAFLCFWDTSPDKYVMGREFLEGKYGMLADYACALYDLSHQQQLSLTVDFYDVKDEITLNVDGVPTTITKDDLDQHNASLLGICLNPVTKNFEIRWDTSTSTIRPYLVDQSGNKYDLNEDTFDVKIEYDDAVDIEDLCLWYGMDSDKATYEGIKKKKCWTVNDVKTNLSSSSSSYWGSSYSRAYSSASSAAYSRLSTIMSTNEANESYILSTSHDSMSVVRYDNYDVDVWVTSSYCSHEDPADSHWDYYGHYRITYTKHNEQWTRKCQKHGFEYCGGHIGLSIQGNVYSTTNEQLGICGTYDKNDEYPIVSGFDYSANGYGKIYGKVKPEDIEFDDSGNPPPLQAAIQQAAKNVFKVTEHPQGSYVGANVGLNINVKDGELAKDDVYEVSENAPEVRLYRDIFDWDSSLLKGYHNFPSLKEWWNTYKGWNEDNMSLVSEKVSRNWRGTYNIDYSYELGGQLALDSMKDVNNIVDALKATYGDSFTSERELAVRAALYFVGRGHYSEDHSDHSFLTQLCTTDKTTSAVINGELKTYSLDGNCTAGTDADFANFVINRAGYAINSAKNSDASSEYNKKRNEAYEAFVAAGNDAKDFEYEPFVPTEYTANPSIIDGCTQLSYYGYSGLLPADIIVHEGTDSLDLSGLNFSAKSLKDRMAFTELLQNQYNTHYVIYIGTVNTDVKLLADGDGTASIKAGTPITVDLAKIGGLGNIYLHTGVDNKATLSDETYSSMLRFSNTNYIWVTSPDSRTKYIKFPVG